jgi:hypothetical protein
MDQAGYGKCREPFVKAGLVKAPVREMAILAGGSIPPEISRQALGRLHAPRVVGMSGTESRCDVPRVMEVAKKFELEILPPPGA